MDNITELGRASQARTSSTNFRGDSMKTARVLSTGIAGMLGTFPILLAGAAGSPVLAASQNSNSTVAATPVAASTSATKTKTQLTSAEAVSIVNKLFPQLAKTNASPQAMLQTDPMDSSRFVYQIFWNQFRGGQHGGPNVAQNFAGASLDANTGQLLTYNSQSNSWLPSAAVKAATAAKIAQAWVKKLAPLQAPEVSMVPSSGPSGTGYNYLFVRKVNGVWAPFDEIAVQLDAAGNLLNYNFSWHHATFPKVPTAILGLANATATYQQALHLQLQYQTVYSQYGPEKTRLVYTPLNSPNLSPFYNGLPLIDALTGKTLMPDGQPVSGQAKQGGASAASTSGTGAASNPSSTSGSGSANSGAASNLTPLVANGPVKWPVPAKQPFTKSELEQQIRSQLGLTGADWVLGGASQSMNSNGFLSAHPSWQFNFTNQQTHEQLYIGIDATDGVIFQYNQNSPSVSPTGTQGTTNPVTLPSQSQLQQTADQFVEKVFPNLTGAITADPSSQVYGAPGQVFESYSFVIDGVPLSAMQVALNSVTGQVQSYFLNADPSASYPSPRFAISVQNAVNTYLQRDPVELQYMLPEQQKPGSPQVSYGANAQLVYSGAPMPNGIGTLNALTGQWANLGLPGFTGPNPSGLASGTMLDRALAELQSHGVIQAGDGKVSASAVITRAQFVAWLARAYNMNIGTSNPPQFPDVPSSNPYSSEISEAIMQGWLPLGTAFHPNAPLTQLQAADWLVKWLGWYGVAANPSLFKLPYSNVNEIPTVDRGAVTIAVEDGMLSLQKGKFNANASMTQGEAALAIVHAVQALLATGQA